MGHSETSMSQLTSEPQRDGRGTEGRRDGRPEGQGDRGQGTEAFMLSVIISATLMDVPDY